ncbi:MAG: hypothetical protein JWR09_5201, partial [Mucilaginibacter sp.]|nr:hypothetical protein [Mucilaginibacter sp.]
YYIMENYWSFDVASTYTPFLDQLESLLGNDNEDFNIIRIEDDFGFYYQFTSIHLTNIDEPDKVYSNGIQLVQLLNGILFLIYEDAPQIQGLNDLYNEGKSRVVYKKSPISGTFNIASYKNSIIKLTGRPVSDLLQIAKQNQDVLDLLYILGEEITYHKLYMAYETLKSIAGDTTEFESSIGTELKKQVKALTFVTNNFEAIGTQARHRNYKFETPENPMSLEDAETLIKTLAHLIIEKHLSIKLPFIKKPNWEGSDLF